jgi:hypothetical protein
MQNQVVGNFSEDDVSPEIASAYREAEARGLPRGWTCSIDVRLTYGLFPIPIYTRLCSHIFFDDSRKEIGGNGLLLTRGDHVIPFRKHLQYP